MEVGVPRTRFLRKNSNVFVCQALDVAFISKHGVMRFKICLQY